MLGLLAAADSDQRLFISWSTVGWTILTAAVMIIATVVIIRIVGLRSLSKMSSFDFAVTVGIGTILGSTVTATTPISEGALAIASLLAVQWAVAQFRRRSFGARIVDNQPLLLVRDGQFLPGALDHARVTRSDVYGKLRQAGVHGLDEVRAVVLETTGDISVVTGDRPLDPELWDNVRNATAADFGPASDQRFGRDAEGR